MITPSVFLNIPIPKCAQALAATPPVCPPRDADSLTPGLVDELGQDHGIPEAMIRYERHLSYGLSDIIIILQRPYVKNYEAPFHTIVENSPTLKWLDAAIRFCTKGARSIFNVTVLNAFCLQPDAGNTGMDEACHQFIARVLQAKKPKVVLQCHSDPYKDDWMNRFNCGASNYELAINMVPIDEAHTTTFIQSFHPSCAVNNTDCRPEYQALLVHHLLVAFGALGGHIEVPDCIEELRELCLKRGQRKMKPNIKYWQAASYIEDAFHSRYTGIETFEAMVGFADDTPAEDVARRLTRVGEMFFALQSLAKGDCAPGSLAIAKTMTFYWKAHFARSPIFTQIAAMLQAQGTEQAAWFRSGAGFARRRRQLTEQSLDGLWINERGEKHLIRKISRVIAGTNTYLSATTTFELGTAINLANSAACCEIMMKESVDPKWLMRTSYFKDIESMVHKLAEQVLQTQYDDQSRRLMSKHIHESGI